MAMRYRPSRKPSHGYGTGMFRRPDETARKRYFLRYRVPVDVWPRLVVQVDFIVLDVLFLMSERSTPSGSMEMFVAVEARTGALLASSVSGSNEGNS